MGRGLGPSHQPRAEPCRQPQRVERLVGGREALLAMIRGKRKAGKVDQFLVVLIVALAMGVTLTGCNLPTQIPTTVPPSTATSISTVTPDPRATETGGQPGGGTATQPPTQNSPTPITCPTPTPTPTPTPIPTINLTSLVIFTVEGGQIWDLGDQNAIMIGTKDVAKAIARDINRFSENKEWVTSLGEVWPINPERAFLKVYGGIVEFYRRSNVDCTTGMREINPENDECGGWAGGYMDWQYSTDPRVGEIFADMYIHWVYDKWELGADGVMLSEMGQNRSDHMNSNMINWIHLAMEKH